MDFPIPKSFAEVVFGVFALVGIAFTILSLRQERREYAIRMTCVFFLFALTVVANNFWTYFAAIFILATHITELEFLQSLAAIVRGDKSYFNFRKAVRGRMTKETATSNASSSKSKRTLMEYMILNTLWTKQVNKWPDLSLYFTFTMDFPTPTERQAFREAGSKLIGEGLIAESDNKQYLFTIAGFDYCKNHYNEFPSEQWWPEEVIDTENLKKVSEGENQ